MIQRSRDKLKKIFYRMFCNDKLVRCGKKIEKKNHQRCSGVVFVKFGQYYL